MRLKTTLAVGAAALVASASLVAPTTATAAQSGDRADVSTHLAAQLTRLDAGTPTAVMVHGATLQQARDAVAATGMTLVTSSTGSASWSPPAPPTRCRRCAPSPA